MLVDVTGRWKDSYRIRSGRAPRWMSALTEPGICVAHPWRVVASWFGIVALLIVLVGAVGGSLRDEFEIPGSDTQRAMDLIKSEFASEQGGVLNVVFAAPQGERLDTPERKAAIDEAIARLGSSEFAPSGNEAGIESVADPFQPETFAANGLIAYAEAQFSETIEDEDRARVVAVEDAVRQTVAPVGVTVEYNGEAEFPPIEQGTQELLGLLAALIVLLIVFRTLVATTIPIALAITAVLNAFLLLFILAGLTDVNTITPLLVSMIGLGVGIDYSLFIVTRFRQLLHEGLAPRAAAAEAGATAGRAVLFAGLTVAISVTGLSVFGLDFVTKLGIGSALGVLTTVLIANSLLIAVLGLLGHRIDRLKVPFLRPLRESEQAREKTPIARWGRFVAANSKVVFTVLLLVGVGLASTSTLVRLGASDQGTQPVEQTARRAYDLLAEGFGAGFNGPIPIVVDVNDDPQAAQRIYDGVQGLEGVASAGPPQFNDEKSVAIVFVVPDSAPQDEATGTLVDRLRNEVVPAATNGSDAVVYVSGLTAAFKDIADRIMERLPLFLLYVIGVTFILLAMAFRSIVISLTAAGHDHPLRLHRLRRAHARRPGGPLPRTHGPGSDGSDRDVRPADRLRDPLRALDGLHGLPHEPHPGGARTRPEYPGLGRAWHRRHWPRDRGRSGDHGDGLRGVRAHG
jgi:RND superfamily putative drug exporter